MVRGATHPLAPKIKKLFLADEDVGRLAQHTPHAAGCAVEELVKQLVAGAAAIAQEKGLKTVTAPCLKAYMQTLDPAVRDHFADVINRIPDLADGPAPKVKRPRQPKAAQDEADGSPKKRGRVPNKAPDAGPAPAAPLAGFSAPAGFGAPAGFSAPSHGVLPAQHLLAPGTAAAMIGQPAQQQHAAGSLQGAGRQAEALLASNAPAAHTTGAVVAAAVIEEQEDDYDAE